MSYVRSADGCRIHYRVTGRSSAPPLLMIQGLGMDKHGWDIQRFVFSLRYRVIALDNRGAGRSDKPTGDYDLGQMAADAVAVLDDVGVDRAHVVGASMGGAIAQFLAVLWPERVRSLTLVCTSCRNQLWRKELLESWAWDAENRGMGAMAGHAARWVIGPRSFRRLVPLVGWLGPLGFGRSAEAFAAQVDAILAADDSLAERLATISVPTLVVVGNQDILTPRGDSEELAEAIPTAELVVISGAAHGLMIEHATTFNRILGDFLSRAERAYQDGAPLRRGCRGQSALAGAAQLPTGPAHRPIWAASGPVRQVGRQIEHRIGGRPVRTQQATATMACSLRSKIETNSVPCSSRNSENEAASGSHSVRSMTWA